MFAPVFDTLAASNSVTLLVGGAIMPRIYSFGEVVGQPVDTPYVVWQTVGGGPENLLADVADKDAVSVQLDVYAGTATECRNLAKAVRDALEPVCYMVSGPRENREADTRLFRVSMDFDWIINH